MNDFFKIPIAQPIKALDEAMNTADAETAAELHRIAVFLMELYEVTYPLPPLLPSTGDQ